MNTYMTQLTSRIYTKFSKKNIILPNEFNYFLYIFPTLNAFLGVVKSCKTHGKTKQMFLSLRGRSLRRDFYHFIPFQDEYFSHYNPFRVKIKSLKSFCFWYSQHRAIFVHAFFTYLRILLNAKSIFIKITPKNCTLFLVGQFQSLIDFFEMLFL